MAAPITIVLTAGGTGGHLFPAQALAEELGRRGHRLVLMTDRRGLAYADRFGGADVLDVPSASPAGGLTSKLKAGIALARGGFRAMKHLRQIAPSAIVGFGGYASFPALWAANRQSRPIVLHEQNAHLGKVNRVFGKHAAAIALSFKKTRALESGMRTETVGNPVRDAVLAIRQHGFTAPEHDGPLNLLVFGGSQGAAIFADTVPAALAELPAPMRQRLRVTQQVRVEQLDLVEAAYVEAGITADLAPFFDNMADLIRDAHLVLARAGASTVAELTIAGRPSVLVPYPHAADDHQTANAEALVEAGAAWLIPNAKFDAATCQRTVQALLEDPAALATMAEKAQALGRPDAAARLADLIEELGAVA